MKKQKKSAASSVKAKDLGERNIINQIVLPIVAKHHSLFLGSDCAVLPFDNLRSLLITTDAGPKITFLSSLKIGTNIDLGHFFATMSFSDIASMGGEPLALLAACIFPKDFPVDDIEKIIKGISQSCIDHNAKYIGGDTKEGDNLRVITTAVGLVENSKILSRKGAKLGDKVFISGILGKTLSSYISAYKLRNKLTHKRIKRPKARIDLGKILKSNSTVTSCMDMSDGPIAAARTLSEMNKVTLLLNLDNLKIALPPDKNISKDTWNNLVFNVGGDFELMFTVDPSASSYFRRLGCIECGIVEKKRFARERKDIVSLIEPWEHFKSTDTITKIIEGLI